MNPFDQAIINANRLSGLDGFVGKLKKKVKKVFKKVEDHVKTSLKAHEQFVRNTVKDPKNILKYTEQKHRAVIKSANNVRTELHKATVPKEIRETVNKAGATIANNKAFRIVVTAIASAYGFGLAASAAFGALDAYNIKLAKAALIKGAKASLEESLSEAEKAEIDEALSFMVDLSPQDQQAVLETLTPALQTYAKKYLAKARINKPQQTPGEKAATQAAFKAGMEIGNDPTINGVIADLMAQGKTPAEIEKIIRESSFFKETSESVKTAALKPIIQNSTGNDKIGEVLAINAAKQTKAENKWLAPAIGAGIFLTQIM